jgi:amino acid transporter
MVYTKLAILIIISALLSSKGHLDNFTPIFDSHSSLLDILIISSVTFVAYEGFQLVINAYDEMENPQKNIPKAIYTSIIIATLLYIVLAVGALSTIPKEAIIKDKEYALAAGAKVLLGNFGTFIVVFGALLATSSAISGTLFGASRLMAVVATDGYLPKKLATRRKVHIPAYAIITMSLFSFALILSGGLQIILEFGSITFIIVSFLMAYANFKMRAKTNTRIFPAVVAMLGLLMAGILIFYFELKESPWQLLYIMGMYVVLIIGAYIYARKKAALLAK